MTLTIPFNQRFLLDVTDDCYILETGSLNLFLSETDHFENLSTPLIFITKVEKGSYLFPFSFPKEKGYLVALSIEPCTLKPVQKEMLERETSIIKYYDWMLKFNHLFPSSLDFPSNVLTSSPTILSPQETAQPIKEIDSLASNLLWINPHEKGINLFGISEISLEAEKIYPITPHIWLINQSAKPVEIEVLKDLSSELFWKSVENFKPLLGKLILFSIDQKKEKELERYQHEKKITLSQFDQAISDLSSLLENNEPLYIDQKTLNPTLRTLKLIWHKMNIQLLDKGESFIPSQNPFNDIAEISAHYGVNLRTITLYRDWYKKDLGPLLGFLKESLKPVALIPSDEGYKILNLETEEIITINSDLEDLLLNKAFVFYKNFSRKPKLTFFEVLSFGYGDQGKNLKMVLFLSVLAALLAIFFPFVTNIVYNLIIPNSDYLLLAQLSVAYFTVAISIFIFKYVNENIFVRINSIAEHNLQLAIFQRVFDLPMNFFKQYEIGDLMMRTLAFDNIQKVIIGPNLRVVIEGIFAFFSFIPMFYFSPVLALFTLGISALVLIVSFLVINVTYRESIKIYQYKSEIDTFVFQILNSISKIKSAGKEYLSFILWEKMFFNVEKLTWKIARISDVANAFNWTISNGGTLLVMAILILLILPPNMESKDFDFGKFTGFMSAFGFFIQSFVALMNVLIVVSFTGALWKRGEIIFKQTPEWTLDKVDPGVLSGRIDLNNLSFQYEKDSAYILEDINLTIHPREFVAIVGASGSGKSTLLKLLLGFENPSIGAIYYDGKDLNTLDFKKLRSQIGAVLQDTKIINGTLRDNIMGGGYYSDEEIYDALHFAGFGEDLKLLPAQLETLLLDGGKTFSGGQKQRILIAKAIIGKPKILFMDEATSALDNETQNLVTKNIDRLNITRIVIAHRLSTIQKADKIVVLEKSRIVEVGTFKELSEKKGAFYKILNQQKLV